MANATRSGPLDSESFGSAFKANRKEFGAGHVFIWRGTPYTTYFKEEVPKKSDASQPKSQASKTTPGPKILGTTPRFYTAEALAESILPTTPIPAGPKTVRSLSRSLNPNEAVPSPSNRVTPKPARFTDRVTIGAAPATPPRVHPSPDTGISSRVPAPAPKQAPDLVSIDTTVPEGALRKAPQASSTPVSAAPPSYDPETDPYKVSPSARAWQFSKDVIIPWAPVVGGAVAAPVVAYKGTKLAWKGAGLAVSTPGALVRRVSAARARRSIAKTLPAIAEEANKLKGLQTLKKAYPTLDDMQINALYDKQNKSAPQAAGPPLTTQQRAANAAAATQRNQAAPAVATPTPAPTTTTAPIAQSAAPTPTATTPATSSAAPAVANNPTAPQSAGGTQAGPSLTAEHRTAIKGFAEKSLGTDYSPLQDLHDLIGGNKELFPQAMGEFAKARKAAEKAARPSRRKGGGASIGGAVGALLAGAIASQAMKYSKDKK